MTLRVGVIGVGMIGQDHVRRLNTVLAGARVVAVTDLDPVRAQDVASRLGVPRVHPTGPDVIADPQVDAVLVASWGPSHEEYVVASIAAGKPVFCEKPLAETPDACLRMVAAEVAAGHRLVQVGYMRRYDAAYQALKGVLDSGAIGTPLIVHCAHRNVSVPAFFTAESLITDSCVHEIDATRWLLGEEVVGVQVLTPRRNGNAGGRQDPLIVLLRTQSGVIVDVELSMNIRYGYDVRCELVGEDGTAALGEGTEVLLRRAGQVGSPVPPDWRVRFLRAYDVELQDWIDAVSTGRARGPSVWDGYVASVVSGAALEALHTGAWTPVELAAKPALYS